MIAVPTSTYRLQLHRDFGFDAARAILGYLGELGVTDVYTSPILRAERGSTHGYNIVAHDQLHPELGDEAAFRAFVAALREAGMGYVLDVVPNHMGVATGENAWWNDVLENGPASLYADYFDIEWDPPKVGLKDKVLFPILGRQYGEALEAGEITLAREGGALLIRYYEHRLPAAPRTWISVLEPALERLGLAEGDPARMEYESVLFALKNLPRGGALSDEERRERAREKEVVKRRIAALCGDNAAVRAAIDAEIARIDGAPDGSSPGGDGRAPDPARFDRLDAILREQHYRLSSWRVAKEEINYRRFFDVNQLAAVRMESEAVFDAAHALLFRLIDEGAVTGLRLDHTDGLYDPAEYFRKLAARCERAAGGRGVYVVAEKILERGERLPPEWLIAGTTGYDFLAAVNGLFVDAGAERAMTDAYVRYTGDSAPFAELVHECKRLIVRTSLSSEAHVLAQALERIAEGDRRSRDFTLSSLYTAIAQTVAAFPVYRTYLREDGSREPDDDRYIARAIGAAKRRTPEINASVFDFLKDVLLLPPGASAAHVRFVMRFQQLTGPVMAKGVEDTAFYRYERLVSLNEVGGDPRRFGGSPADFHADNQARRARWPRAMLASSTHDTKRGEDVRARIDVLSEIPEAWADKVEAFARVAAAHRAAPPSGGAAEDAADDAAPPVPRRSDEYLFYQMAIGALPFGATAIPPGLVDRVAAFASKAAKEAKIATSWINPDEAYERGLDAFVRGMLDDPAFVAELVALARRIDRAAATNALAQVVLKIASPGVVDTYQGCEDWSQSLVDPDNRRPVDYARLAARLGALRERRDRRALARELRDRFEDGDVKLFVTHAALALRREDPALFLEGDYVAIDGGPHVIAFARRLGSSAPRADRPRDEPSRDPSGARAAIAVVPRLTARIVGPERFAVGDAWGDRTIALPVRGRLRDAFTGATLDASAGPVALADVLATLPVALLVSA